MNRPITGERVGRKHQTKRFAIQEGERPSGWRELVGMAAVLARAINVNIKITGV